MLLFQLSDCLYLHWTLAGECKTRLHERRENVSVVRILVVGTIFSAPVRSFGTLSAIVDRLHDIVGKCKAAFGRSWFNFGSIGFQLGKSASCRVASDRWKLESEFWFTPQHCGRFLRRLRGRFVSLLCTVEDLGNLRPLVYRL